MKEGEAKKSEVETKAQTYPLAINRGRFFENDGVQYLWGGDDSTTNFIVDTLLLKPAQFHFGIGRERFPALLDPSFVSAEDAGAWLSDTSRVLGFTLGNTVRAYPIELLKEHEVVNDVVDGHPVFAAYCVLADLGAIYDRVIGDETFTFALSGYTYFDPNVWDGMDGFVLWDRESESLWWPLIGKAVSGPMVGIPMKVFDENRWAQTTWGEWRAAHPESVVLDRGQDFERPKTWPHFSAAEIRNARGEKPSQSSVAPRWGDNGEKEE